MSIANITQFQSYAYNQTNTIDAELRRNIRGRPQRTDREINAIKSQERAKGGVCLSLCFEWMWKMYSKKGVTAQSRLDSLDVGAAIGRQNMQTDIWTDSGVSGAEAINATAQIIGLDLTSTPVGSNVQHLIDYSDLTPISNKLRSSKKECHLMDYRWYDDDPSANMVIDGAEYGIRQVAGHAVAWYLSSGKILGYGQHVYFFDPNMGEYKIPKKRIAYFVTEYFDAVAELFNGSFTQPWPRSYMLMDYKKGTPRQQVIRRQLRGRRPDAFQPIPKKSQRKRPSQKKPKGKPKRVKVF